MPKLSGAASKASPSKKEVSDAKVKTKIGKLSIPAYVNKQWRENSQLKKVGSCIRDGVLVAGLSFTARLVKEFATDKDAETGEALSRGGNYYRNLIDKYEAAADDRAVAAVSQVDGAVTPSGSAIRKSAVMAMYKFKSGVHDGLLSWMESCDDPTDGEVIGVFKSLADLKPSLAQKEDMVTGMSIAAWVALYATRIKPDIHAKYSGHLDVILFEARKQYRKCDEDEDSFVDEHYAIFVLLMGNAFKTLVAAESWYVARQELVIVCQWKVGNLVWGKCKIDVQNEFVAQQCDEVIQMISKRLDKNSPVTLTYIKEAAKSIKAKIAADPIAQEDDTCATRKVVLNQFGHDVVHTMGSIPSDVDQRLWNLVRCSAVKHGHVDPVSVELLLAKEGWDIPNIAFAEDVLSKMIAARSVVNKDLQALPTKDRSSILSSLKKTAEIAKMRDPYHGQTIIYLKALSQDVGATRLEDSFYGAMVTEAGQPRSLSAASQSCADLQKSALYGWCDEDITKQIDAGCDVLYKMSLAEVPKFANPSDFMLRFKSKMPDKLVVHAGKTGVAALKALLVTTQSTKDATHLDLLNLFRFCLNATDRLAVETITETLEGSEEEEEEGDKEAEGADGEDKKEKKEKTPKKSSPQGKYQVGGSCSSAHPAQPAAKKPKVAAKDEDATLKAALAMFNDN